MLSSPCLSAKKGLGAAANRSLLLSAKGFDQKVNHVMGVLKTLFSFHVGLFVCAFSSPFMRYLVCQETSVYVTNPNIRLLIVYKHY